MQKSKLPRDLTLVEPHKYCVLTIHHTILAEKGPLFENAKKSLMAKILTPTTKPLSLAALAFNQKNRNPKT